MPQHLLLLLVFLAIHFILLSASGLPDPDPAAIQPSEVLPTAAPPAIIPAFPEQSAAAACPLDLSGDLIASISAACSPRRNRRASRARCCPALTAGLYSAYADSALSPAVPSATTDLPAIPDDSESCAGTAERAISARGVELPRVNATCGAAYCYCGIRLRRLSCIAGGVASGGDGRWFPREEWGRRIEKDCARPGFAGCSLCLRTLTQLKNDGGNATATEGMSIRPRGRDCPLMALTWLLSRNRTRYLLTATAILRVFMAAAGDGEEDPTSCLISHEEMPFAVGSSEISGGELSGGGTLLPAPLTAAFSLLLVLWSFFDNGR